MLANDSSYEIDHIIPISISFEDSQANKVLVESGQNRKKSNTTPFRYLSSSTDTWSYGEYKAYVLDLRKNNFIGNKQTALLLFEEDIAKESVILGFISRNLNDTRYSSRTVLSELKQFFKNNEKDTKIKVINGTMTSQFRKKILDYKKDRELDHRHHAEDAMICCFSALSLNKYQNEFVNQETGEIIDEDALLKLTKDKSAPYLSAAGFDMRKKIIVARERTKFSHKVDRKVNRELSNQTIYGTREAEGSLYVVNKTSNIYDYNEKDYQAKFKKKLDHDPPQFLMYKHDPKTWEKLMNVIVKLGLLMSNRQYSFSTLRILVIVKRRRAGLLAELGFITLKIVTSLIFGAKEGT